MMLTRTVLAAGALAVFVGFPISGALAQSSSPMNDSGTSASAPAADTQQSAQPSAQIDDATLQKAAKAYVKVKQIVHQTKQASPSGDSAAQPDQASAQSEKIAAVKSAGLDPQQYNQVLQVVQNDPQLLQKFSSYVNQNGGDSD
jgi:Domain of unknown function (DUF4168)